MKRIIVVIVGIVFAIGLVSMMNTKPSPQAQVQVEEVLEDEPTQVTMKYSTDPNDDAELLKDLSDEDELPLVNGKRPTVQGLRDFGLELAKKLVAKLSKWQTAKSEMKLTEHANVQPVAQREHLWKVYGRGDGHGNPFGWTAFVSFDGEDIGKPYRLVEFKFMEQDFTEEVKN